MLAGDRGAGDNYWLDSGNYPQSVVGERMAEGEVRTSASTRASDDRVHASSHRQGAAAMCTLGGHRVNWGAARLHGHIVGAGVAVVGAGAVAVAEGWQPD